MLARAWRRRGEGLDCGLGRNDGGWGVRSVRRILIPTIYSPATYPLDKIFTTMYCKSNHSLGNDRHAGARDMRQDREQATDTRRKARRRQPVGAGGFIARTLLVALAHGDGPGPHHRRPPLPWRGPSPTFPSGRLLPRPPPVVEEPSPTATFGVGYHTPTPTPADTNTPTPVPTNTPHAHAHLEDRVRFSSHEHPHKHPPRLPIVLPSSPAIRPSARYPNAPPSARTSAIRSRPPTRTATPSPTRSLMVLKANSPLTAPPVRSRWLTA